jgi:hypothetical protein
MKLGILNELSNVLKSLIHEFATEISNFIV